MSNFEADCAFCDVDSLKSRMIHSGSAVLSIVSRPWYRPNHVLAIPKRHIRPGDILTSDEEAEIMHETRVLANIIQTEYGCMTFQKTRPSHIGNGITMEHLHFHVYPILEADTALVPVPQANDFHIPTDEEIQSTIAFIQSHRTV